MLYNIGESNWRWMFATGAIPSAVFFIMLLFVSETPRFLYIKGKKEEAMKVLERIGGIELAVKEMEEIQNSHNGNTGNLKMLLSPSIRKVLWIGFGLAVFVQMSGINTIIDYSPKIFSSAGWKINAGLFATFGLGIVNFICTWVSILIIDRFGRRPMYIIGSAGMTLMLLGLTFLGLIGNFSGLTVLILILGFIIFFSSFVGPVFWTYISEIFPNRMRGIAMSVPVFTQWVFNAAIVLIFPSMLNHLNTGITFGILAIFASGQLLFAIKYMKETKGKSLEEIEKIWETDNSIKTKRT
jgi:SP family arabinose:H+ symporter-like MFS transporter